MLLADSNSLITEVDQSSTRDSTFVDMTESPEFTILPVSKSINSVFLFHGKDN